MIAENDFVLRSDKRVAAIERQRDPTATPLATGDLGRSIAKMRSSLAMIKGRRTELALLHSSKPANYMASIRKPTSPMCSPSSSICGPASRLDELMPCVGGRALHQ
jgi:hypothetical protein